jgi:hypothetical protein
MPDPHQNYQQNLGANQLSSLTDNNNNKNHCTAHMFKAEEI